MRSMTIAALLVLSACATTANLQLEVVARSPEECDLYEPVIEEVVEFYAINHDLDIDGYCTVGDHDGTSITLVADTLRVDKVMMDPVQSFEAGHARYYVYDEIVYVQVDSNTVLDPRGYSRTARKCNKWGYHWGAITVPRVTTLAHEFGHFLMLKHSDDPNNLMAAQADILSLNDEQDLEIQNWLGCL